MAMTRVELGRKHVCAECGAKFYDMGKEEPTCPKCGSVAPLNSSAKPAKTTATRKRAMETADEGAIDELDTDGIDDGEDDDDDDLGVEEVNLSEENAEAMLGQIPSGDDEDAVGGANASMDNLDDDEEFPSEVDYSESGSDTDDEDAEDDD